MKFTTNKPTKAAHSAFTLMEVLAALLFMAIVIPVAIEGIRIASLAGEVGQRKKIAARIGQSALDEMRANTQTQNSVSSGQVQEGALTYRYTIRSETWPEDAMRLATVDVAFAVQGRNYDVQLSTLLAQQ
ncbi:MAG: type IV pilus modification PilV family protein [Limisphaerales bacterium]